MNREEAIQAALGYACGREDGSRVPTWPGAAEGAAEFAEKFADAVDDVNAGRYHYQPAIRHAYETWQASQGATILDNVHRAFDPGPRTDAPEPAPEVRYHSSDDMTGPEFDGIAEPVATVLRPDGSVDAYGYCAVIDQRTPEPEREAG